MLTDEDRAWIKTLDCELWPPSDTIPPLVRQLEAMLGKVPEVPKPPEPREFLTDKEVARLFKIVEDAPLLTQLFSHGMICGVGISFFEHEQYPGAGPELLLGVKDKHLKLTRTAYDHIQCKPRKERVAGNVSDEAWGLFTKYTHSEQNRAWLKMYNIEMKFEKTNYDY
jgi:hypothetical protein